MREGIRPIPVERHKAKRSRWRWIGWTALFLLAAGLSGGILIFERRDPLSGHEFSLGEPAPRSIFSPFEIAYENRQATQGVREQASLQVPPVYRIDATVREKARLEIDKFFKTVQDQLAQAAAQGQKPELGDLGRALSKPTMRMLSEETALPGIRKRSEEVVAAFYGQGIFDAKIKQDLLGNRVPKVALIDEERRETIRTPLELWSDADLRRFADTVDPDFQKDKAFKGVILEIVEHWVRANVQLDDKETAVRQREASEAVVPVKAVIKRNELIIQRGMLVTTEIKERLDLMQKELNKHKVLHKLLSVSWWVLLVYALSLAYLFLFERKLLFSVRLICLYLGSLVLTLILSKGLLFFFPDSYYWMPTALPPLLLVLLAPHNMAFMAAGAMTLLVAPLADMRPDVILATLVSGITAAFAGIGVRKRIQFLKVGLVIGLAYFCVLSFYQIYEEETMAEALRIGSFGWINGLLITLPLAFLLVPLCEGLFQLVTDITLLELSDLNHPLLKRMIVEAPGTYHHSLVVSTLAESACERIGANALLARVGCYFHDIGKIAEAEYFTENQPNPNASEHHRMSPRMSSRIIMNHVKDGIELGKKYKLKQPILRFIPEHQGTSVIYYFYRKALDEAGPGEKVSIQYFRYPGPTPQSRETAVAMLADSTEAASRSLKEPTAEGIRQLVRKVINDKFIDGQFDACELTLKNLHKIQESFVHNLMAIFHTRVAYPAKPEVCDHPNLFQEGEFAKYRLDGPKPAG